MTADDLDRLAALAEKATPLPWDRLYDDYGESEPPDIRPGTFFLTDAPTGDQHPLAQAVSPVDSAYIVALVNVAPALIEAARLGVAWAMTEAALPEGWRRRLAQTDDDAGTWEAVAVSPAFWMAEPDADDEIAAGTGPDPAAALQALTAKLREPVR